jgi:hypothetical protein
MVKETKQRNRSGLVVVSHFRYTGRCGKCENTKIT